MTSPVEYLLSLPPAMASAFGTLRGRPEGDWVASCDPEGVKLGSGGGVAHMLAAAWSASGDSQLGAWLALRKRVVLLAGGQSRRLPAYAVTGKVLMPVPLIPGVPGQRFDQTLLDLQAEDYGAVLECAPESSRVLVASGDVFLRMPRQLPPIPEADIVGFGMAVAPEVAKDFGVFFTSRGAPGRVEFFLQKPSPEAILEHAQDHMYLVDTGLWLLSSRAVEALMRLSGWNGAGFEGGMPRACELYSGIGPALGERPLRHDPAISGLSSAVVPLPDAEFYHFGTTRQMIESASLLQARGGDDPFAPRLWRKPRLDVFVLNSDFRFEQRAQSGGKIWIENSALPAATVLPGENVLTGLPPGEWSFEICKGLCIDVVPVGAKGHVVRPYDIDDPFSGPVADALWLGSSVSAWFQARGLSLDDAGIALDSDIQEAPLFALVEGIDSHWMNWLTLPKPDDNPAFRDVWLAAPRYSAASLGSAANIQRIFAQRDCMAAGAIVPFWEHRATNPFFQVDLANAAQTFASSGRPVPSPSSAGVLDRMHEAAFASAIERVRGRDAQSLEREAFSVLGERVVSLAAERPCQPKGTLIDDQILWARSPVRLDLAGGWSDTPPFCLMHGGSVVNIAVDLNGQAPVQVFARVSQEKRIVIRSIDLGAEAEIRNLRDLDGVAEIGAEFSLAKAALALGGFHPRFRADGAESLDEILEEFGGGLELSLLAATPKGSGLGTSSVLSATLLAAISSAGGLGWDHMEIIRRTLALEQMLTAGGGWQDQAGGLYHGVKLIETAPGLDQTPFVRWLPETLLGPQYANHAALLYYTGMTRVARGILQEIVRGMLLNSSRHLRTLFAIREHSRAAYAALLGQSWEALGRVVRRSWDLNQRLDPGTCPAEIADLLRRISDLTTGAKLLGAGGGGYLLILAKDAAAGLRIRSLLTSAPPNPRARFVDFTVSGTGLQITRS